MDESTLWGHLKPELASLGKFQKVSDRFTPGIPDVLGCLSSRGVALELKQVKGVNTLKVKFRPGQLDWMKDWEEAGGLSLIVSSKGSTVYIHNWVHGLVLESGLPLKEWEDTCELVFTKDRKNKWRDLAELIRGVV